MEKPNVILALSIDQEEISNTIKASQKYLDFIDSPDFYEGGMGDLQHDIFEKAMIEIFGDKVFDFINSKYD